MHRTAKRFLRVRTALLAQYELGHFPDVYTQLQKHRISCFVLQILGENNGPWVS